MQTLLTLRDSDVFPGTTDANPASFHERRAARAVLVDERDRVALLYVGNKTYHKLPGGGVEDGEDLQAALQRELMEELGCKAETIAEVGEVIELKNEHTERQTSHCWLARQIGEAHPPAFTDKEIRDGFAIVWADDIDHAIAILQHDTTTNYTGNFIRRRDLAFLEAAKPLILQLAKGVE